MATSVAGAALGCYLVSLNVASERAKLETVESKIVLAQRDIRLLQTEIGTRGRLAQLERWNAGFIRLSAPTADQFLEGGFQLATLVKPAPKTAIGAPVVLASAPVEQGVTRPATTSDGDEAGVPQTARAPAVAQRASPSASDMMHIASYEKPAAPSHGAATAPTKPTTTKPTASKLAATKSVKIASADALAPLPGARSAAKASPSATAKSSGPASSKTKESGSPK